MPDKPRKADEEVLANLMNELAEGVLEMSDEEILAAAREARENPEDAAHRVAMRTRTYHLPDDPRDRRVLLDVVVRRNPRVRSAVTLQHRDLTSLSDADVESQLKKLQEIGFLDADGKPLGEEE
jgi:hypothetical protein